MAPLFTLTYTGAAVWEALADWTTSDKIAESLARRFDVDATTALGDVTEFLAQLEQIGALLTREVEA